MLSTSTASFPKLRRVRTVEFRPCRPEWFESLLSSPEASSGPAFLHDPDLATEINQASNRSRSTSL